MNNLADAIESAARSIVRIDGGRRIPSTGIAWSEDVVITAAHTLRNDENLIGWDPSTDVAVLRSKALTPIAWNESAQRVGNFVAVAGHSNRATFGIISAIDDYIDVDATLPPGFSGGPLIDFAGEANDCVGKAIGMNTSRIRRNGTTIPIAALRRVVGAILQFGAVRRPFLGVGVHPVDGGVIVLSLAPEGPAKKAGLLVGDVITSPLQELLREEKIGTEATLHITRGGEPREVRITIGAT